MTHGKGAESSGGRIQKKVDEAEPSAKKKASSGPAQAGTRTYPAQFPKQHLVKPGVESQLEPRPMFEAPAYKGSSKLQGMAALVTGGDSGIGRAVSVLYAREGADIAIVYLDEHSDAQETKAAVEREGGGASSFVATWPMRLFAATPSNAPCRNSAISTFS